MESLFRPQQDVLLLAERELDHAFRGEIAEAERGTLVRNHHVVDTQAPGLDLPAGLARRGHQPRLDEGGEHADAGFDLVPRDRDAQQVGGKRAFLEGLARGFGRGLGRLAAMDDRRDLGGEDLLRLCLLYTSRCV